MTNLHRITVLFQLSFASLAVQLGQKALHFILQI